MQIITTAIWKVLHKSFLEKCNTTCFRANFFDLTHANVYNMHILLSTAAIQQIQCREHLMPGH